MALLNIPIFFSDFPYKPVLQGYTYVTEAYWVFNVKCEAPVASSDSLTMVFKADIFAYTTTISIDKDVEEDKVNETLQKHDRLISYEFKKGRM